MDGLFKVSNLTLSFCKQIEGWLTFKNEQTKELIKVKWITKWNTIFKFFH